MTFLAAMTMAVLLAASYLLFRSWFAPAVIYTASWTLALFSIALLEPLLYGVSGAATFYFSVSAVLFILGTLFGQGFRRPAAPAPIPGGWKSSKMQVVVDGMLLVLAITVPLLLYQLFSSGDLATAIAELKDARIESVALSGEVGSFGLLKNAPVLAQFLVLMAIFINRGLRRDRIRIAIAAVLWLLVSLPSGSKLIALQLPFMVAAGFAMVRQRIPWRIAGLSVLAFGMAFLAGLYYTNFSYLSEAGDSVSLHQLLATMASYAYGGVIGFSKMLQLQLSFAFTQSPLRTPMYLIDALALMFGFDPPFPLESQHAPFMDVGPGLSGNVYSVLYAYYGAGGTAGVFAWSLLAGLVSGWTYRALTKGSGWAYFVYPWVAYACVMSVSSEQLFGAVLAIAKLLILLALTGLLALKRLRLIGGFSSSRDQGRT